MSVVNVRMKQRRKTAANWTSANEVLLDGEIGIETDTRKLKFGDGATAWNSLPYVGESPGTYTPTWTAVTTNPTLGNGTLTGRYLVTNGLCYVSIFMLGGSTTTFGSGVWSFSLPFAASATATGTAMFFDDGTNFRTGVSQVVSGASTLSLTTDAATNNVRSNIPFVWAVNDYLRTSIVYLV